MTKAAQNGGRFNLDTATAKADAEAEPFRFTWHGESYEIPPSTRWPLKVSALLGEGELEEALALLLGKAATDKLTEEEITLGALTVLFEEVGRKAGVGSLPNLSLPPPPGLTRT